MNQSVNAEWDWEKADIGLTGFNMHRAHAIIPAKDLKLEITKQQREQLNQVCSTVESEYQVRLNEERENTGESVLPQRRAEIKLEIATEHFKKVEEILDDEQLWMHKAIQYERRSWGLGPFRQYGDPWLLEYLEVDDEQQSEIRTEIQRCLEEYDEFLKSTIQTDWKRILSEFPPAAKQKLDEDLGPMPQFGGHLYHRITLPRPLSTVK